jgi:putative transposase
MEYAMADRPSIDVSEFLGKQLEAASPDLLREMVRTFAEALMGADADNVCNAAYGERSDERVNSRNGYRDRPWDTRVGSIELRVPKLRTGSYFPDWLLGRRTRAEQALISVVATAYLLGVSTRRVEGLVQTLGIEKLSRSQVSDMAKHLDAEVQAFRSRPLDAGPYTYLWIDALVVKVREDGRTQNVSVMLATAVNRDGQREILGLEVDTAETGAGWLAFLRSLVARGLTGVQLAISDAHGGLTSALAAALPGASWQRCRTHFAANLLAKVPRSAQPVVAGLLRSVFDQPDAEQVHAQFDRVEAQLRERFPAVAAYLADAKDDLLAFSAFPVEHWTKIRSNNPQERLNKEIRRRTDVVGIFPDRTSAIRLIGAVLAEQHDEWSVGRRYLSAESLAKARVKAVTTTADQTKTEPANTPTKEVPALPAAS